MRLFSYFLKPIISFACLWTWSFTIFFVFSLFFEIVMVVGKEMIEFGRLSFLGTRLKSRLCKTFLLPILKFKSLFVVCFNIYKRFGFSFPSLSFTLYPDSSPSISTMTVIFELEASSSRQPQILTSPKLPSSSRQVGNTNISLPKVVFYFL